MDYCFDLSRKPVPYSTTTMPHPRRSVYVACALTFAFFHVLSEISVISVRAIIGCTVHTLTNIPAKVAPVHHALNA
jgi:hypothetical protein